MNDSVFQKKLYFNFGSGFTNLQQKNLKAINFENELYFAFSKFFSSAISVQYGKENSGKYSFVQGNLNAFVSPISSKKISFNIGGGFSYVNYSELINVNCYYINGVLRGESYLVFTNSAFGINYILEGNYSINDTFRIGAKVFFQQYLNGFYNTGFVIKTGLKINKC